MVISNQKSISGDFLESSCLFSEGEKMKVEDIRNLWKAIGKKEGIE